MNVGRTFRKLVKIAAVAVAVLPSFVQAFIPLHEADGSVHAIVDNQATFGQFAIGDPASALIYSIPDVQTLGDDNASFDEKGSAGVRIGINVATAALGIGAQRMSSPQGSALSSVESAAIRGGRPMVAPMTTILGENMTERVIPFAQKTGARTLPWATSADEWAKMRPYQRWKANDGLLRQHIKAGDNFRFIGQDLEYDVLRRQRFDLTGSELLRLEDRLVPYEVVPADEVILTIGRR